MKTVTLSLFETSELPWLHLLPKKIVPDGAQPGTQIWDIPYTIPQLSYASHGHFRYYGKFPSSVAAQILEDHPPRRPGDYLLDNFCGSGTALVEAKLRGIRSYGVDVSWLAVLASNVKTSLINPALVADIAASVISHRIARDVIPADSFVTKWFDNIVIAELDSLRRGIAQVEPSSERDFVLLAYLAIIRRVSRAFDGEVRPHIKKEKPPRGVSQSFAKKVKDMLAGHQVFAEFAEAKCTANAILADNRALGDRFNDGKCYLVISHPPYLNSFDYRPVFSLEYYWGQPFEPHASSSLLNRAEMKAYPATESLTAAYYHHLNDCYKETARIQEKGAVLAVVIGDCTRNKALVPVVENTIELISRTGYHLVERNYRTTHYGLGKYAYDFRADYHGDAPKRDGIFVFLRD